jgi:hypothetical protein
MIQQVAMNYNCPQYDPGGVVFTEARDHDIKDSNIIVGFE